MCALYQCYCIYIPLHLCIFGFLCNCVNLCFSLFASPTCITTASFPCVNIRTLWSSISRSVPLSKNRREFHSYIHTYTHMHTCIHTDIRTYMYRERPGVE